MSDEQPEPDWDNWVLSFQSHPDDNNLYLKFARLRQFVEKLGFKIPLPNQPRKAKAERSHPWKDLPINPRGKKRPYRG